ncbi:LysR family transcriptional regulator [Shinella sedimenti]|uniref:LysR family transcriptional regulator n=1 Tax=Shinella sedimenti TaxID=2919913 RepID=A0ABT0CRE3_9HYPH|nr:LysR family transcriptional regulator [Shinella sedimenti]MCJ8151188.1 LysR family transcriptional regulator [Shinella sedimenti]
MVSNRNELSDLAVFLQIVRSRSFRKAADQLEISVSALSHRMKALEGRLGVRLLNRTNRSVSPTAAGSALAEKVAAGLDLITSGLEELQGRFSGIAGSMRINVLRDAVDLLLTPVLPLFRERYPNIELEIASEDSFVDVTAEGFDAGLRYAGTIPEDMIAVPVTEPLNWVAVASPAYLARSGRPTKPEDLLSHNCIRIRTGRGQIYHWEFERGEDKRQIDVPGALISGSTDVSVSAALSGIGIVYCLEKVAEPHLRTGRLERAVPDWSSLGPPLAFYYSSRRQVPYGLQALIQTIREVQPRHR